MSADRKILVGLDPGPAQTAFVIFDGKRIVDHGIWPNEALTNHYLWKQRNIWCEMIASYGMAVGKEVFETCVWIGRFIEIAKAASGKELTRIHRKEIKLLLCNSFRAKDANVRQALLDLIGPQGTKRDPGPTYGIKSHEWAALAVASVGWSALFGQSTNNGGQTDLTQTKTRRGGNPDAQLAHEHRTNYEHSANDTQSYRKCFCQGASGLRAST